MWEENPGRWENRSVGSRDPRVEGEGVGRRGGRAGPWEAAATTVGLPTRVGARMDGSGFCREQGTDGLGRTGRQEEGGQGNEVVAAGAAGLEKILVLLLFSYLTFAK